MMNIENNKKEKELNLFLKLNRQIINTLDLDQVMQIISDGMAELLEIETGAIYLLEKGSKLFLGATTPALPESFPDDLRYAALEHHPNAGIAIQSGDPYVLPDAMSAILTDQEKEIVELRKLRSLIYLPLRKGEDILGLLILGTKNKSRAFTPSEIELSQGLADQLSIGLSNAILHQEIIKQNANLKEQIEKRKLAEDELRLSKKRLSTAVRIARIGHWEYDVATDNFYFTDEFYAFLRTTADEQGGYSMSAQEYANRFVAPEHQDLVAKEIEQGKASTDPEYAKLIEHRVVFGDGNTGYIHVYLRIEKDESGKTVKFFGANQDITGIKQIEEKLREALEKATESDRLKSAFLANISHEIRTPLNAIQGFSQLLTSSELDNESRINYNGIINRSVKTLLDIVHNIMEISKIESGTYVTENSAFQLNAFIEKIVVDHQLTARDKGMEILFHPGLEKRESYIFSDSESLRKALSYLIDNALKFSDRGKIEVGYEVVGIDMQFWVKDEGLGIAPDLQSQIFERFTKFNTHTSKFEEGSGLGLTIAKGIIEIIGGKIWLESEIDKGATFIFSLPYIKVDDGQFKTAKS